MSRPVPCLALEGRHRGPAQRNSASPPPPPPRDGAALSPFAQTGFASPRPCLPIVFERVILPSVCRLINARGDAKKSICIGIENFSNESVSYEVRKAVGLGFV